MLRRSFLKWLGIAPAAPVEIFDIKGKKYKIVKMATVKQECSGCYPCEKGQTYEVNEEYKAYMEKKWKQKCPDMIALKGPDGNSHMVSKFLVNVFDKYVEIK